MASVFEYLLRPEHWDNIFVNMAYVWLSTKFAFAVLRCWWDYRAKQFTDCFGQAVIDTSEFVFERNSIDCFSQRHANYWFEVVKDMSGYRVEKE